MAGKVEGGEQTEGPCQRKLWLSTERTTLPNGGFGIHLVSRLTKSRFAEMSVLKSLPSCRREMDRNVRENRAIQYGALDVCKKMR